MITCTRRLTFEAGHRVFLHESKCRNLHGHSYKVEIRARGHLDDLGRVIDFAVLKQLIGGWIDEHLDHGFIVWNEDREAIAALQMLPGQKIYRMPYNPTAENIARHLKNDICPAMLHGTGVVVDRITVQETENCFAEDDATPIMVEMDAEAAAKWKELSRFAVEATV